MAGARGVLPGFAALAAVAVASHLLAARLPYVNALVLAVAIGALLANLVDLPPQLDAGIERHDLLLETGIVLLGASIPLGALVDTGGVVVALVLATVGFGILLVEALSRWVVPVSRHEGSLLAAGASICGVSAVVAVGRSIDADRETLAYVAGAVLLFDAVTLLVFPALAVPLGLPDQVFGVWAGLAMFSTGPVAAAGFAVSAEAGKWATITKLARNALIGAVAVGYAMAYARQRDAPGPSTLAARAGEVWRQFPKFLVGFALVALVANAGVLTAGQVALVESASAWLFALAFAGVGFSIRLGRMREAGVGPVAVLLVYLVVVGVATLVAASALL